MWIDDRPITVNGRTYTFRFKTKEAMALQKHFAVNGKVPSVPDLVNRALVEESIEHAVALLWAGFRTHHPELTMDDVVAIFDEIGSIQIGGVFQDAAQSLSPDPADMKELGVPERPPEAAQSAKKKTKPRNGDGSISSPATAA